MNFNNFFLSVGAKASHTSKSLIELHNLPPSADTTKGPVVIEFQFHAVSPLKICSIIMSFSSNDTPGHEKTTMSVIKDSLPCILLVLTDITDGPY